MLILGLNTSGPACETVLLQDGQVIAERHQAMTRGQDARLPGLVSELFEETGLAMTNLSRIAVVTGPGSFTGVRVGVAFARGLSLALKIPSVGVTALEAALPDGQQGSAIVLLPAKRRPPEITYWAQRFRSGAATDQPEEIGLDNLAEELTAHPHFVYGDGLEALCERLSDLQIHPARPDAARAAAISEKAEDILPPASPVYVRAPDAALPGGRKP